MTAILQRSSWCRTSPLYLTNPNAPSKRDILGTVLLSVLAGHYRYAHITTLRCGHAAVAWQSRWSRAQNCSSLQFMGLRYNYWDEWAQFGPQPPYRSATFLDALGRL